ncbi:MAG: SCO family protein [Myxococcales bacterium]
MGSKIKFGAVAAAVFAAALLHPSSAQAAWGKEYFPNVALTTQDGKVVRLFDDLLKGKKVAVNLIYTRCTATCPLETAKLSQVAKILGDRFGKEIFFVSVSIDPGHDTPEVLKAYAAKFHTPPGWTFVTGDDNDIKLVAKKFGLSSITDVRNKDGHQPSLMIGDVDSGNWMRNSAIDNPRFLATQMVNFLNLSKTDKPGIGYAEGSANFKAPDQGKYMFQTRCAACHTVGKGDSVGPDLAGLTSRRDKAWVTRYLHEPDAMLAQKDPIAVSLFEKFKAVRMPNLALSKYEITTLVEYLEKADVPQAAPAPPAQKTARNMAMPN